MRYNPELTDAGHMHEFVPVSRHISVSLALALFLSAGHRGRGAGCRHLARPATNLFI